MTDLKKDGQPRQKPGPKPGTKYRKKGEVPDKPVDLVGDGQEALDIRDVHRGVSTSWLAQAFGMDGTTVKKRLANCPPIGKNRNFPVYSLRQAAQYLVEPKIDIGAYLRSMNPSQLPSYLQDAYWSAMLKRQKFEENAKLLWRTEDVLDVFGEFAMMMKSTVQLWVENQDRVHGLTPEMRLTMTQQGDNLLEEIHRMMIEAPLKRSTTSTAAEPHGEDAAKEAIETEDDDVI